MANELKFFGWQRSGIFELSSGTLADGRLEASVELILKDRHNAADTSGPKTINFHILGPKDVSGLQPKAILRRMPPARTLDAETNKCVHLDFRSLDLPWRFTPQLKGIADPKKLRPWIVLLVGTTDELTIEAGQVSIAASVLQDYDLTESARWAHIQDDNQKKIARLLSPRVLQPKSAYLAVIVPAFKADGTDSWSSTLTSGIVLPAYDFWSFSTAERGDFVTLASRLKPRLAPPELGRAPMEYPRTNPATSMSIRGALSPIGGTDTSLPTAVSTDMTVLTQPLTDPKGRPVIGLPNYGDAWKDQPQTTTWGQEANLDPRHRGVGGLGLWGGVELQEIISETAENESGALGIADQRIRHLTFGLAMAGSLWQRRLPADPHHQVFLFGPSMRRIMTKQGSVSAQITGSDRPLTPAFFSSAARRLFRSGPARIRHAQPGANRPENLLREGNRCPPPPRKDVPGLPHQDKLDRRYQLDPLDKLVQSQAGNKEALYQQVLRWMEKFDFKKYGDQYADQLKKLFEWIKSCMEKGEGIPIYELLKILDPQDPKDMRERLPDLIRDFDKTPDSDDFLILVDKIRTEEPDRPCRPVDIPKLAAQLVAAIDPTALNPPAAIRVLATIEGLDDQPLTPPEICLGLDISAWRFLRDNAPDWLLPGIGQIKENDVMAFETNPIFIDAFLLGFNTQTLAELRWRNIPIATGCTPLRKFWERIDYSVNQMADDIIGIANWTDSSGMGATQHQIPSASGTDLVLVFKSSLFRRYPQTIVYIVPSLLDANGDPDWEADPDFSATKSYPVFLGNIGEDMTFFGFDISPDQARTQWAVLEEPPPGYKFRSEPVSTWDNDRKNRFANATNGADFAHAAFQDPSRVIIRGDSIIPQ